MEIEIVEQGEGQLALVLHGGGGPATVAGLAAHVAGYRHVLLPTHPGWNGSPRHGSVQSVADLARLYVEMLAGRGLRDVSLVGSSMGGWVALEMALQAAPGAIARVVVVDGVGVEVPEAPMVDFFSLDARGVATHAYHEPERFFVDPAMLPPERVAVMRTNMASLRALAGPRMFDPTLRARLAGISVPTLVIWGESDRIATPAYGRVLAAAVPGARFEQIEAAGHLPQLERPNVSFELIDAFLSGTAG